MKKRAIAVITVIVVLVVVFLIGTGFRKRTDVILVDYSVSEDGTAINLGVQVSSSMGYIRGFKNNGGGVKPHYLTFYSTFGGLNSSFGVVDSRVVELEVDDTEILDLNKILEELEKISMAVEAIQIWCEKMKVIRNEEN